MKAPHICLFDRSCWRDWWQYGAPMRIHWGDNREHFWTIPGFGWRLRSCYRRAEPVDVVVAPKGLSSHVTLTLDPDTAELVFAEAERRGMTVSDYLRWAALRPVGQPIVTVTTASGVTLTDNYTTGSAS